MRATTCVLFRLFQWVSWASIASVTACGSPPVCLGGELGCLDVPVPEFPSFREDIPHMFLYCRGNRCHNAEATLADGYSVDLWLYGCDGIYHEILEDRVETLTSGPRLSPAEDAADAENSFYYLKIIGVGDKGGRPLNEKGELLFLRWIQQGAVNDC